MEKEILLAVYGLIAGLIDSVAGGGGLVTLPALMWVLGSGLDAVATNKIVGLTGALVAGVVYWRSGHFRLRRSLVFVAAVGAGAVVGSLLTPLIPEWAFRWFILFTSPAVFWVISRREMWTRVQIAPSSLVRVLGCGFAAGVYDGMWGPGGGTFMFLVLFLVGRLPLLEALAASKAANVGSAGLALVSFGARGYVHWEVGLWMAAAMAVGALVGATFATRRAAQIVRPVLGVVTLLLIVKVLWAG